LISGVTSRFRCDAVYAASKRYRQEVNTLLMDVLTNGDAIKLPDEGAVERNSTNGGGYKALDMVFLASDKAQFDIRYHSQNFRF
jgi:hypothetical protein